jgi:hypothetical protein
MLKDAFRLRLSEADGMSHGGLCEALDFFRMTRSAGMGKSQGM